MFQSMLLTDEPLSVSELTAQVKDALESDERFADVRVRGELSSIVRAASGHLYFTLKDTETQLKCVMWRMSAQRLRSIPRMGDAVVVRGHIGVYEKDGVYQFYADSIIEEGKGDLYADFERLKRQLESEGLFDVSRKRKLPVFPHTLGIVTSATGAALQDVLHVLGRRYPLMRVLLAPSLVQGEEAPAQLVQAVQALNTYGNCDVILVTRGGGSLEELWAFNDERVVRAVAASAVPVVSGVGHEIDYTLCDFAADVRAPTPSAAAEIITPDINDMRLAIDAAQQRLEQVTLRRVDLMRAALEALRRELRLLNPLVRVSQTRQRLNDLAARLSAAMTARLGLQRATLSGLVGRLATLGPQSTLERGYAIVRRGDDSTLLRSVRAVKTGEGISIQLADGELDATVR
jgi:exodeoxyribonuclease VII large subunit